MPEGTARDTAVPEADSTRPTGENAIAARSSAQEERRADSHLRRQPAHDQRPSERAPLTSFDVRCSAFDVRMALLLRLRPPRHARRPLPGVVRALQPAPLRCQCEHAIPDCVICYDWLREPREEYIQR